jgi:hypothetical protein
MWRCAWYAGILKTVETYRTRLREKLGLKSRAELCRFAAESGFLDRDRVEPPERRRKSLPRCTVFP